MPDATIIIDARRFSPYVQNLRDNIAEHFENLKPFPPAELFSIMPLNPRDEETKRRLSDRSDFIFTSNGDRATGTSHGDSFVAKFRDDNIGNIDISIPSTLSLSTCTGEDCVREYEFLSAGDPTYVTIPEIRRRHSRFGDTFIFEKLKFSSRFFYVYLKNANGKITLKVIVELRKNENITDTDHLVAECCCGSGEWIVWRSHDLVTKYMCEVSKDKPGINWKAHRFFTTENEANAWVNENCRYGCRPD